MTHSAIRVHALKHGATLGIFSPSEPITARRQQRLQSGIAILEAQGYQTRLAPHALEHTGYTAGPLSHRLADIATLISDPTVDALFASWGGKSCNQLVRTLDFSAFRAARKAVLGFSDISVLLNAIASETDLITFHGPNIVGKVDESSHFTLDLLRQRGIPAANLLGNTAHTCAEALQSGQATGRLFGGNLSTFTLGYACSKVSKRVVDGGIFFWEEASLPPQLIDQYLTTLANMGLLDRISGMIVGMFITEDDQEWKRTDPFEPILSIMSGRDIPVLYCPTFGHADLENPILPIGAVCTLDTRSSTLFAEHPLVD